MALEANAPSPIDLLRNNDIEELERDEPKCGRKTYRAGYFQVVREQLIFQHERIERLERQIISLIELSRRQHIEHERELAAVRRRINAVGILVSKKGN